MKKINFYPVVAFLFFCHSLTGQDALTMNDFNFNRASYNSAFIAQVATPLNASFTSSLGKGIQNTSKVNFLAYANLDKHGFALGLKLNSKFYGIFKTNTAEFLYAKALKVNDDQSLFLGLNVGMHFSRLDRNKFTDYVNMEDPFLMENELPQYRLTTGLGFGYAYKDKWKAGISLPVLLKSKNDLNPAFAINTSYRFIVSNEFNVTPQILLYGSTISAPTFEGNLTLDYKEFLWFKLGGRTTEAMVLGFGWQVKFVQLGYLYNLNFVEYAEVNPGVHHVNVSFMFDGKKD